jgi:hypothetical protein
MLAAWTGSVRVLIFYIPEEFTLFQTF